MKQFWRRYLRRIVIFAVIYFAILVYPVIHVLALITPGWQPDTSALMAIILLPLLGRMAYARMPNAFGRLLAALALTWFGLCFQLLALLLVYAVGSTVIASVGWNFTSAAWGWTLVGLIALLGVAGFINAQVLTVKRIPLALNKASANRNPAVAGHRLVQITDVHIGSRSPALLDRIVARTNALAPDYVLITGDLVDAANISREQLAALAELQAPCFYCIGNHERYVDLSAIDQRLRSLGIRVLRNESSIDGPFQFIGIDDAEDRDQVARVLQTLAISAKHFPILLYHRPHGFESAAAAGIRLMLCGHTHNGQLIPFNLLVRRMFPQFCGLYPNHNGSAHLYVSPGTGTWGPLLRIGSRSEISCFEFQPCDGAAKSRVKT